MKKSIFILLLASFLASPVLADGYYRGKPESCHKGKKECCVKKNMTKALKFIVKLPFRLVSSTAVGVYGIIARQDFDGFEDGYDVI